MDLSLDSFSDDLIQEFDKKRNSFARPALIVKIEEEHEEVVNELPDSTSSRISSTSFLPTTREQEDNTTLEDSLSTERSDSSDSSDRRHSALSEATIGPVSKPYPPRPLQYSPIMAPIRLSSDTTSSEVRVTESSHGSNTTAPCSKAIMQADVPIKLLKEQKTNRKSNSHSLPAINNREHTSSPMPGSAVKRRSFFSLRFC
ncbi:hypothetical protein A0J61_05297 [Choanephora cucurbitarum]|uniref:Uncharacterized protein n=1 Tax=Choanephora cucurbitarum TaxID=101091 RepID=A0A1C7NC33_9FUNG|nr:hypothetical protein A0J61_05297 [Choanephora cucurbitarum]